MSRYVVRELEGYRVNLPVGEAAGGNRKPGVSVMVLDSRWNYRLVREWATERAGNGHRNTKLARIRAEAAQLADALNAEVTTTASPPRHLALVTPYDVLVAEAYGTAVQIEREWYRADLLPPSTKKTPAEPNHPGQSSTGPNKGD